MEVMAQEDGIGLSANQVGLPVRMVVLNWQGSGICLVNPTIRAYGKRKRKMEGCLSFPDIFVEVNRPAKCHVKAWDLYGDEIDEEVTGDLATVVQHEMDHLDGTLFIDRLSEFQRKAAMDGNLEAHLRAMEHAWEQYGCKRPFPADAFNGILKEYCGVEPQIQQHAQPAHTG